MFPQVRPSIRLLEKSFFACLYRLRVGLSAYPVSLNGTSYETTFLSSMIINTRFSPMEGVDAGTPLRGALAFGLAMIVAWVGCE